MDKELWSKILQFDLDHPMSEYGFSTRIARENFWTKNFTNEAILEYKKFMFLAATSDMMVSPSPIVDEVWHQHLIFTQSYTEFCKLLGKNIQHIPSTHNRNEFQKFKQAKERTQKLYINVFGEQPQNIWNYSDMYEALELSKARFKIRTVIIGGIMAFIALIFPAIFLLWDLYIHIDNPGFIVFYLTAFGLVIALLEFYNSTTLYNIFKGINKNSFIYNLHPLELIYLKYHKLSDVINGFANQFIKDERIIVNQDNSLTPGKEFIPETLEEHAIQESLKGHVKVFYPVLLRQIAMKPVFANIPNCMDAYKKYFNKSKVFGKLFYLNFGILLLMLLFGFVRLSTGLLRDKSVGFIGFVMVGLSALVVFYLNRLTKNNCISSINDYYRFNKEVKEQSHSSWEWNYFFMGATFYIPLFAPLAAYVEKNNDSSGSSSCGSSCGGGGCGGCGGGGD